jgi:type II secretory pathway pseudopilin PulG
MIVATFGPTTGWHGKQITHEGGGFILEGHGVITASDVLSYDRRGQIEWAYAGLREWVEQLAHAPTAAAQPGQQSSQVGVAGFAFALAGILVPLLWIVGLVLSWRDVKRARRENLRHGLATAGLIISSIGVGLLVVGLVAAMAIPMFLGQRDKANEAAVKEGAHSIQVGVQSWAVDHDDTYPDTSQVSRSGLTGYVDIWPTNPFTGLPMDQGTSAGQYFYERTETGFRMIAFGTDGSPVITVP